MPLAVLIVAAVLTGMAWGAFNATIIVVAKLNPIIVTLATNFIGARGAVPGVPAGAGADEQRRLRLRPRQFRRALGDLVADAGAGAAGRLLSAAHALWTARHRGRRQPRRGQGARHLARKPRGSPSSSPPAALSGFAAVLFAASSGPFNPSSGSVLQLNVIAAVILAGVSLAGGRGNLWMLLLSVGLLSTIPTSLVFFGLSSDTQSIFQGLILVVAVAIDGMRARKGTP